MLRGVRDTSTAPSTRPSTTTGTATNTRSCVVRLIDSQLTAPLSGARSRSIATGAPCSASATSSCLTMSRPRSALAVEATTMPCASTMRMPASVISRTLASTGASVLATPSAIGSAGRAAGTGSGARGRIGESARSSWGNSARQRSDEAGAGATPQSDFANGMAASASGEARSSQAAR